MSLLSHLVRFCSVGGSLDKHRNIPEHILGPISVSVVRGLQYLWSLKIMHRGKSVGPCISALHRSNCPYYMQIGILLMVHRH